MDERFLDSRRSRIRHASAGVYATATGAASVMWTSTGGWRALVDGHLVSALLLGIAPLGLWWFVAGIGLRVIRRFDGPPPGRRREGP